MPSKKSISLFVTYAREDEIYRKELAKWLKPLQQQGLIGISNHKAILSGEYRENHIDYHLETADLVLLLISPDFIDSDYCYQNEMQRAIQRHERGECVVVLIFLRCTDIATTPLAKLQVLPTDLKPVKSWSDLDEAFHNITQGLSKLIQRLQVLSHFKSSTVSHNTQSLTDHNAAIDKVRLYGEITRILTGTERHELQWLTGVVKEYAPNLLATLTPDKPVWAEQMGADQFGPYAVFIFNGIKQIFRWIKPGEFMMGSPPHEDKRYDDEDLHQVTISQGFWIADTAVTQAFWRAVMGANPCHFRDNSLNPMDSVSWLDVQEFIQRLIAFYHGLPVSLPSEAQWEYACRAGTISPFSLGENITPLLVNYNGIKPYAGADHGLNRKRTVPVKSLPPNAWGLYEMHGNVWEWCQDNWQEHLAVAIAVDIDMSSEERDRRVLRGGSWLSGGVLCRSAYRCYWHQGLRNSSAGFRLVLNQ
ncbi:SUMF1/EgtB/PvdO family nonheme iron enzyme [Methylomonas paludis]|uniref:SUMF1/EgtB/PvdO family nonheme iron enzyme n=1 Tax=Methylomonas paludis TaxID=1173101 RepID=A0A975MPS0_9GAMM|nr:SUMF1/EgtB/PvdO family nonheme iron enzyme [Methylomonas paludis]QWF71773.1 SUMF1/EgtB/PvdO family nonheme iron enzyme [Methylomonas paludis]